MFEAIVSVENLEEDVVKVGPTSPRDMKFHFSERTKTVIVAVSDSAHNVLESFGLISNKNKILKDSNDVNYQLLTQVNTGAPTTYQRFVFSETNLCVVMAAKHESF